MATRLSFADRIDEAQKQKNMLYAVEKTLPREIAKVLLNNKEFQDSLRGKDGEAGISGMNGDQGLMGAKGEKGDKGDSGRDGIDGKDGRDGIDGKDGKDAPGLSAIDLSAFEDGKYSFNYLRNVPKVITDFKNQVREIAGQEVLNRRTTGFIQDLANVSITGIVDTNTLVWDAAANMFKPGVGGGSTSPLTTKGDLYTYDTAGTRLGVGADGQILIADSTQATGLRWGKIGLNYLGTWNATTNTPTIVSGTGVGGDYYIVSVAGTTSIDGITDWEIGDWIIFNDETSTWQKIDNSEAWLQVTEWAPGVPVKANQIQTQDGRLVQRIAAGTTGATFDATEAGLYTLINLGTPKAFVGGKFYYATEQVTVGARLLSRTANGVANGAFTNTEAALYTLLSNEVPSVWASTNYEYQGELFTVGTRIVVRTAADGVSGLTFNATESSNYSVIEPMALTTYQASTLYYADEMFSANGVVYRRYFTGDSAATFTGTELDNWSIDSYDNLSISTPSQTRTAATFTVGYSDGELLLQPAGATQVITFDNIATPEGKEFGFNGTVDSAKLITWTTAGGLTIEDPVSHLPVASFNNSTWIDNAEFSFQVIRAGNVLRLRGI